MAVIVSFGGVEAKLTRADTHLKAIKDEITTFIKPDPYRLVGKYDGATGYITAKAEFLRPIPQDTWGTLIGDCVHNLRCALDHLAHQLLILAGGIPKIGRGGTQFPIYDTATGPKGGPRTVAITGTAGQVVGPVLDFVKGIQPYVRVNDPHNHPLFLLAELDNMDKHRMLAVTAMAMSDFEISISGLSGFNLEAEEIGWVGPFDETTILARLRAVQTRPDAYVELDHLGTVDIAFGSTCAAADLPLVPTLEELRDYVNNVVEVLRCKGLRFRNI